MHGIDHLAQMVHLGDPKVVQQLIGSLNISQRKIYVLQYVAVEQQRLEVNCRDGHGESWTHGLSTAQPVEEEPHLL